MQGPESHTSVVCPGCPALLEPTKYSVLFEGSLRTMCTDCANNY